MRETPPLEIAVFGSGRGSNFSAILSALQRGEIPNARIRLVISNNSNAGILETARLHGIPAKHISAKQFTGEEEFVGAVRNTLRTHDVNFIVLAGYMKRFPPQLIPAYKGRIINVHPALLPKFGGKGMYGMHVHEAVLESKENQSGATVHVVDEEYDRGTILLQESIPVEPADTPESLAAKVLAVEHALLPRALRMFAEGKIRTDNNHTTSR